MIVQTRSGDFHCRPDCCVRSSALCAELDEADRAEFEKLARQLRYASKDTLFSEGEDARTVFSIVEGVVRLYKLLPDGRRQIVGFALPGDFIGMAPAKTYGCSGDAIGPVAVCRYLREPFQRFVARRPYMLMRMNEFARRELGQAQDQLLLLGRRSAEEKVVAFLIAWRDRLARLDGVHKTLALPMGRQDIADFLGLTIETVCRTFTKLEREKVLVTVPDGVRVLDDKRFDELAAA